MVLRKERGISITTVDEQLSNKPRSSLIPALSVGHVSRMLRSPSSFAYRA